MNRARLAALVTLVTVVGVGTATYTIYGPNSSAITATHFADAGVTQPTHVATCPVRVEPACAAAYGTGLYETVRFPVFVTGTPGTDGGGFDVLLPPRTTRVAGRCLEVMDWSRCTLDVVTAPMLAAVMAYWDSDVPVQVARNSSTHVIPDCRDVDGGWNDAHPPVDCTTVDGGWRGCNVLPRAEMKGTQCLSAPTNRVRAGEIVEDSL